MPLSFHSDDEKYFQYQYLNARDYVLPFVKRQHSVAAQEVLEVGCGAGGVLKAFAEEGCHAVGIDLNEKKITFGRRQFEDQKLGNDVELVISDVFDFANDEENLNRYDVIVLKDSIEHIPNQRELLSLLKNCLAKDGIIFVGFPPWLMPYGGHQQIATSRMSQAPFLHLLPRALYERILRRLGEPEEIISELIEIVETRLTINSFKLCVNGAGLQISHQELYFINPIY